MRGGLSRKEMERVGIETCERVARGEWTAEEAAWDAEIVERTVYRSMATYRDGGGAALAAKPHPGRPRLLTERELKKLDAVEVSSIERLLRLATKPVMG